MIKLNTENREIAVGRASKNPQKGLLADFDNAWFDYPILSRTHAKFTASPHKRVSVPLRRMDQANTKLSLQEVYLEDCGSTHGTFLDKRRFEAGIPYIVGSGEVITFGQSVTSGAGELTALSAF